MVAVRGISFPTGVRKFSATIHSLRAMESPSAKIK